MSCIKHCNPNKSQIIHANYGNLTVLSNDGDYITRGQIQKAIDYKSDGHGNVYSAGTGETMEEFTVYTNCTDEAQAIYALFTSTRAPACGAGAIVSDCCAPAVFKTLILTGMTPPNESGTVNYFQFNYRGYYAGIGE